MVFIVFMLCYMVYYLKLVNVLNKTKTEKDSEIFIKWKNLLLFYNRRVRTFFVKGELSEKIKVNRVNSPLIDSAWLYSAEAALCYT